MCGYLSDKCLAVLLLCTVRAVTEVQNYDTATSTSASRLTGSVRLERTSRFYIQINNVRDIRDTHLSRANQRKLLTTGPIEASTVTTATSVLAGGRSTKQMISSAKSSKSATNTSSEAKSKSTINSLVSTVASFGVYPAPPAKTSATAHTHVSRKNTSATTTTTVTTSMTTDSRLISLKSTTTATANSLPVSSVTVKAASNTTPTTVKISPTSATMSSATRTDSNTKTTSVVHGFHQTSQHLSGLSKKVKPESTTTYSPRVTFSSATQSGNYLNSKTTPLLDTSTNQSRVTTESLSHSTETTTTSRSGITFYGASPSGNHSVSKTSILLHPCTNDSMLKTNPFSQSTKATTTKEITSSRPQSTFSAAAAAAAAAAALGNDSTPKTPPLVKIFIKQDKVLAEAFSRNLVVTFIVIYIFIIFLAFFGNLVVIFVITWARMVRSFTDLFIVSLAVSDILISTINMPIQLNLIVINEWKMGDFFCKFAHYLQAVTIVANILTLTAIAIDRYLVICHTEVSRKVHTKRFAILGLIIVWFVSLCVVCPQLIIQRIEPRIKIDFNTHDILGISHVCVETFPKPEKYDRKIFSLTIFVGAYLVPVFVMAFTYGAIAHRLWVQQPIGDIVANPRSHTRSIKQKRKVIKMLMLLVVAFTVLWFPFFTASLYQEFVKTDSTFRIAVVVLQLVGYSNCCFNPIIYTFLNNKFQLEFRRIFCRRRRRQVVIATVHVARCRSHSNPHPVHSNPHPVHSNPHPVHSNPHPVHSNPHSVHSNPHPVLSNPHPVHSNPHPDHSDPHPDHSNPHPDHSNAHPDHSNPHPDHSNPHPVHSNPHPDHSNPHPDHSDLHSSSHNDVIVEGVSKPDGSSNI